MNRKESAKQRSVDVIIPVYGPDERFFTLLRRLAAQTVRPNRVILMNTEQPLWDRAGGDRRLREAGLTDLVEVHHLPKRSFDHGRTRNEGVAYSDADYFVMMTQDALPADRRLLEKLLEPMGESVSAAADGRSKIAMSYARQLPNPEADLIERCARRFNYPPESRVKTVSDLPELGIKTYFASNVCAAYSRQVFDRLGGFVNRAIFNEDMVYACGLMKAGYSICYAAEARVLHSHQYCGIQQFRRNFDLAVSQAEHPEVFRGIRSESEGIRMVRHVSGILLRHGRDGVILLPRLVWQSGMKYLGYRLGKNFRRLPRPLVLRFTGNRTYWEQETAE